MQKVLGVVLILAALALAIAPVFTDCQSDGKFLETAAGKKVPMKCHWTGTAEIAASVPIFLVGVFTLRKQRKETTRFASLIGMSSGVLALLLPTVLIGTCGMDTMVCNLLMKPILLTAGILAIVASVALFVIARDPEPPTTASFA